MYKTTSIIKVPFLVLLMSACLSMLFACGGGGGGGSSDSGDSKSSPTGIRIIHAALDYPALQINSAESGVLSSAEFGAVAYHGGVASGPVNLVVSSSSNPLAGLWSAGTELAKNQHKSVLVYGGYKEGDLRFSLLDDSGVSAYNQQAAVRIINGVVNSGQISASVTGVLTTGATSVGASSGYSLIAPGLYEFSVFSDGAVIGKVSGSIKAGSSYSVVSHGAAGYFVTSNLLQD